MASSTAGPLADQVSEDRIWHGLMELAEFAEPGMQGWTRRVFSPQYQASREFTGGLMEAAGLEVSLDPAGNLIGRSPGRDPGLPALVLGSHTDTVAGGGRFDGMVGVLAAVEVARVLTAAPLRHPLWVVDFLGEEPNRFGLSCLGSRAVTGHLSPANLQLQDGSGSTLAEALSQAGARPPDLGAAQWAPGAVHGYLELHIEQAKQLERAGAELGVVSAIAGISRAAIDLVGCADHAGTTAMEDRHDALLAAAEVVLGVDRLGRSGHGGEGVATAGRLLIEPNAANVVPAHAQLVVEMRSTSPEWLRLTALELEQLVGVAARARSVEAKLDWVSREPPVPCHPQVRSLLTRAAEKLGMGVIEVTSGASHDAAHIARIAPTGMLFIPSREGRSHCPEEWSEPAQVGLGARALLLGVLELDRVGL